MTLKQFIIKWEKDNCRMKKIITKMIPMAELFHKGYRFDWEGHFRYENCEGKQIFVSYIKLDFCAN